MLKDNSREEIAAIKIQSVVRGFFSRKRANIYGQSEGKEIEIYLPFGIKKIGNNNYSYDMIGNYKYKICESDLFYIQIDSMNFKRKKRLKIPEIVTSPFRKADETRSNLLTEQEIDEAVGDFISILENFTLQAASTSNSVSILGLIDVMRLYNEKYIKHPLRLTNNLRCYLDNPQRIDIFANQLVPVEEHKNVEICFVYDKECFPLFNGSRNTPQTLSAAAISSPKNGYQVGKLLVHIQKTFSLPIEKYGPDMVTEHLNNTLQQLMFLQEARKRAELFIKDHPLPSDANQQRVLGLLTVCTEHIISVTNAKEYKDLHEKADRPVLSIRHILHYVKQVICNEAERAWFDQMFKNHRKSIQEILCMNNYIPDYKGGGGSYGNSRGLMQNERYDVIFDLFGNFSNGCSLSKEDINNPLTMEEIKKLTWYGIKSWHHLYENHVSLSNRTHLILQKVINEKGKTEYYPLFEARRIGLMTVEEFTNGKSCVSLAQPNTSINRSDEEKKELTKINPYCL